MKFWMLPDAGSNTIKDVNSFFEAFRREYPAIELEVEVFNRESLWKKLFRLVFEEDASNMPDVVEIPHVWTSLLIKENLIENLTQLDPALSLTSYLAPLIPHCYKRNTKDIYAIPWWMDITALHYRVDHLERVSKAPAKDLATWEGFLDVCARLKQEFNDNPKYYPLQNSDWRGSLSIRNMLPCIWGRGSDLLGEDLARCRFSEPAFMDGVEDFLKVPLNKFMPVLTERGSVGTMLSNRASLFLTRRQGLSIFENEKTDFQVKTLPVPGTGEDNASFISGINLVVMKNSKLKEDALTFIKWLSRPQNQMNYASKMEVFPGLEENFDEFIFASPMRMQTYAKIIATGRALPNNIVLPTATKILNEVLGRAAIRILEGAYTRVFLEENLAYAAKEVNYLLSLYES